MGLLQNWLECRTDVSIILGWIKNNTLLNTAQGNVYWDYQCLELTKCFEKGVGYLGDQNCSSN